MDPDANLEEQLKIANSILDEDQECGFLAADPIDAERLAELVISLDGWIRGGGFLPKRWHACSAK